MNFATAPITTVLTGLKHAGVNVTERDGAVFLHGLAVDVDPRLWRVMQQRRGEFAEAVRGRTYDARRGIAL